MRRVILLVISLSIVFMLLSFLLNEGWRIFRKKPPRPTKQETKMHIEEDLLYFYRESFWNENDFVALLKFKNEFAIAQINSFKSNLKNHEKYILNLRLDFDNSRRATVLSCQAKGIEAGGKYDFDWFLKPLSLTLPRINLKTVDDIEEPRKIPLLQPD